MKTVYRDIVRICVKGHELAFIEQTISLAAHVLWQFLILHLRV